VKSTTLKVQPSGTVVIPHTIDGVPVREIGDWSFHDCPELRSVTIPSCVTNIGKDAFNDCGARRVFRVAEDNPFYKSVSGHLLTKDGETLVWGVNVNGTLTIPDGVKNIAYNAFRDCAGIRGVTFPDSVKNIEDWAFLSCKGLENIAFPDSVKRIAWGTFCGCSGLESVTIGSGVKEIVGVAFEYCTGLKRVSIPEGVVKIGYKAFHECKALTDLRIPSTVEVIEKDAFWDCGELISVTMLGERPNAPNDIFRGCDKLKSIHVPANAKSWAGMKEWLGIPLVFDGDVGEAFSLNAEPGSVTELNLGNVPPLQFVYCPAGKFTMGYKESPAVSKVKDIEITSPFWVSKNVIRADQLESLGITFATNHVTNGEKREAWINDASIVVKELPSVLKHRFGKMLPPGYVFRLPTEAEFEYLQKAEAKGGDGQTNIWGVERLYSGDYIGLLDRAPAYGKGVDVVNRWHDARAWTDLVKVNYENQPDKDPLGWSDDPNWSVFRRGLCGKCNGRCKLITNQRGKLFGFYFVVAPDVDKLNKFYWK